MVALNRILCPVDLSERSIQALAYAGRIAEPYQSALTVLHVVPTFEPMEVRATALFDPVQFVYPMTPQQIEERLREALQAAGIALDRLRVAARAGEPTEVILNEATEADLVVMATHGRKGWERLMLGSVAETVLRSARCPVLTVPLCDAHTPAQMTFSAVLCPVEVVRAAPCPVMTVRPSRGHVQGAGS
jgi:universal stress protein A